MKKAKPSVRYCQVHQFHGKVAVYVGGHTTYMTPEEAQTLAQGILAHTHNAMTVPFGKSTLGTFSLTLSEEAP
jgi:hypothetical protein